MHLPFYTPTEHEEQVNVIAWAQWNTKRFPQLNYLFAVPNGGQRDPVVGKQLKLEGVKRGVPDLFLPWPTGKYHGLWIEMKSKSGVVRKEQKEWHDWLRSVDYRVEVCRSSNEAIDVLIDYLGGQRVTPGPRSKYRVVPRKNGS